ncbi:expressed protein [Baffinella frigidus]|nr:expressed protein [Cryptophyta sp. CCMP2293]
MIDVRICARTSDLVNRVTFLVNQRLQLPSLHLHDQVNSAKSSATSGPQPLTSALQPLTSAPQPLTPATETPPCNPNIMVPLEDAVLGINPP